MINIFRKTAIYLNNMGIPSYFSNIIRENKNILQKKDEILGFSPKTSHFFLDSNSIIYDCLRKNNIDAKTVPRQFEFELIKNVAAKIHEYALTIQPTELLYIAFDGVAPVAKLDQQRMRRNRGGITSQLMNSLKKMNYQEGEREEGEREGEIKDKKSSLQWDKTAITPGTQFMENMGKYLKLYFHRSSENIKNLHAKKIIVTDSSKCGEGEHKIFAHLRELNCSATHNSSNNQYVIYGLDADLIMLCINHLYVHIDQNTVEHNRLFLYRETPEFIRSINRNLIPNENYLLDIGTLGDIVLEQMRVNTSRIDDISKQMIFHDYVLICFFLGNDFMPHFPSINIRRGGIQRLLTVYVQTMQEIGKNYSQNTLTYYNRKGEINIHWSFLKRLVKNMLEEDYSYWMKEYKYREQKERRDREFWKKTDKKKYFAENEGEKILELVPFLFRDTEKLIDPFKKGWQRRYYKYLLGSDVVNRFNKVQNKYTSDVFVHNLSQNFLEGLEWTLKYYTSGCPNWQWRYRYDYPPLLDDLAREVPFFDECKIPCMPPNPVSSTLQLAYVLPKKSLHLLPPKIHFELLRRYSKYYLNDDSSESLEGVNICWAFCSKFWEAHVHLPHIDIEKLTEVVDIKLNQ